MKKAVGLYVKTAILAIIMAFFLGYAFQITEVTGNSMMPVINDDDIVLLNRLAYVKEDPCVGDIVVFRTSLRTTSGEGSYLIKRVAAVSGDVVQTTEGTAKTVEEGYVYVLGDNSAASLDSRNKSIGQVPIDKILGKVEIRIRPFEKIGYIE